MEGELKIGSHISSLQSTRAAPYESGIEVAEELGFDAIELIAMTADELDDYYTPDRCRALGTRTKDAHLEISQFAAYSPYSQGIVSADTDEQAAAFHLLEKAIDVAARLGSPIFNLVSHWPNELSCPHPYPPSYVHPVSRGMNAFPSSKLIPKIDASLDFNALWKRYLDALWRLAGHCRSRGMKLAIEGHANVIVSGTDAMLRLFDTLGGDDIVVNFDTSWHLIQREFLELSILKLKGRIGHVHLRDADGQLNYLVPVGEGIIHWPGVFDALRLIGYDGVVSFEYAGFADYRGVAAASLAHIRPLART